MPNYSPRLPWASGQGFEPEFDLSSEQWTEAQAVYKHEVPTEARNELVKLCNSYLMRRDAELRAAPTSEIAAHANRLEKDLRPFFRWAYGERPNPVSDSYIEFDHRLGSMLEANPIPISASDLVTSDQVDEELENWLNTNNLRLKLNNQSIMEMAIRVAAILAKIGDGNSENPDLNDLEGFTPGLAWKWFLERSHTWANKHSLPRSLDRPDLDDVPPFVKFVYFVHSCFPDDLRHAQINSPEALKEQMRRAFRKQKKQGK
jgi:hypothetical protein